MVVYELLIGISLIRDEPILFAMVKNQEICYCFTYCTTYPPSPPSPYRFPICCTGTFARRFFRTNNLKNQLEIPFCLLPEQIFQCGNTASSLFCTLRRRLGHIKTPSSLASNPHLASHHRHTITINIDLWCQRVISFLLLMFFQFICSC